MTEAREAFYRVCRGCGQFVWTRNNSTDRFACDDCRADGYSDTVRPRDIAR